MWVVIRDGDKDEFCEVPETIVPDSNVTLRLTRIYKPTDEIYEDSSPLVGRLKVYRLISRDEIVETMKF